MAIIEVERQFQKGMEFPSNYEKCIKNEILENKMLFESKQSDVYISDLLTRLDLSGVVHTRYSSDGEGRVSAMTVSSKYQSIFSSINLHKPIIQTYATLLFGEGLGVSDEDEDRDTWLNGDDAENSNGWIYDQSFNQKAYKSVLGAGQTGDGIFKVWQDSEGKARLSTISAEYWFPVISDQSDDLVVADMIVKKYAVGKEDYKNYAQTTEPYSNDKKLLKVEIYEVGKVTYKVFMLSGSKIINQVAWTEETETFIGKKPQNSYEDGLDLIQENDYNYSLIQRYPFQEKDDSIRGQALYTKSTKSSEKSICIRDTQIKRILDKNSDPGMYGPPDMTSENPETGEVIVESQGKYIPTTKEDVTPGYLEYGGNLEANFKEIEKAEKDLYRECKVNAAILAATLEGVGVLSGTAFEKVFAPILAEIKKQRMFIQPCLDRVLKLAYRIENGEDKLQPKYSWKDGLPQSRVEEIKELLLANGGQPIMSQVESIAIGRDLTLLEAEEEQKKISDEQKQRETPILAGIPDFTV